MDVAAGDKLLSITLEAAIIIFQGMASNPRHCERAHKAKVEVGANTFVFKVKESTINLEVNLVNGTSLDDFPD